MYKTVICLFCYMGRQKVKKLKVKSEKDKSLKVPQLSDFPLSDFSTHKTTSYHQRK